MFFGFGILSFIKNTVSINVLSVNKSVVDYSGGSSVIITGSGFTGASSVKFGTTNAASFVVNSDTQITAVTPALTASATPVNVSVGTGTLSSAVEFFAPTNISNNVQWLRGDLGITTSGGFTTVWGDQSGTAFNMASTFASHPPVAPATWINSKPAITWGHDNYSGTGDRLDNNSPPASLTGASAVEGFVVGQDTAHGLAVGVGLWFYGNGGAGWFPFTDGNDYENFCDSTRPAGTGGGIYTVPWLYDIQLDGGAGTLFGTLNGTTIMNSPSTNTVSVSSACTIGNSTLAGFDGQIAEVIIYSRILTSGERARLIAYKQDRYNFATPLTISNLVTWLHVADISDGAVSSIGQGHIFTQGTGVNQPTKSSSPNRITYSASSPDYLTNTDSFLPGAFSVSLLFKLNSLPVSGNFQVLMEIKANNQGVVDFFQIAAMNLAGYQNLSFLVGGASVGINPTLDLLEHTLTITYDGITSGASPSAYTCYLDGVAQTINISSAFGTTGGNSIGTRFGVSNSFDGKFGDIAFFTKVLSSTEASELHQYLLTA